MSHTFALASGNAATARRDLRNGSGADSDVRGNESARVERCAPTEPTLDELGQKLRELRHHLDEVLRSLDRATSTMPIGDLRSDRSSLRCHACNRTGSTSQAGWTLRLCGDDELHPFCPDCDRRYVHGEGRNEAQPKASVQGVQPLRTLGDVAG